MSNLRGFIFILFHAFCIHIFSNVYFIVAASEVSNNDDDSTKNTCTDEGSSCSENVHSEQVKDETVSSPLAFMRAFSDLGTSWNHVIAEYISVVKGADGVDLKGDIRAQDMDEGLKLLYTMVHEAQSAATTQEEKQSWSFTTTPELLTDFGKTIDDVLLAFLRWSVVDNNSFQENKSCKLIGGINEYDETNKEINVSKAFRRLTSYISWMQSVSEDLVDPPLTYASISPSLSTFSLHVTHDSCNRLIWWVNLGKTDLSAFKSQSPKETTRLFVWIAHLLFLDEGAQTNGLVVIDDMGSISFWDYMTMLPLQVGISVDRFLISVTPLKAKNVVLMHLPRWAEIGYGLLSWFLTKKMKSRVTIVSKDDEIETLWKAVGGSTFVPVEFGDYKGELKSDIVAEYNV